MVELEHAIADGYRQGHDAYAAVVPEQLIDEAIASWQKTTGHQLGEDQEAMVRSICGSGDRFQAVVGPAGSGKTAALEVAARAWESAGYEVIGAAVNGTAAEVLQRSTGVPSRTVAGLVTRLDTADSPVISNRTVVLVDEASTLGNRQHARLVHHVTQAGATMRSIGDPAQHGAVEAGGMWAHLVNQHADRVPHLTENRRQSSENMADVRMANTDYRSGRIAEAIGRLETNQRIVTASTSGELLDQLAADWFVDRKTNPDGSSRMIAEHHRERRALNARAQALLRSDGTITGPGVRVGDATFHIGDEVIARAPNRHLHPATDPKAYIRNGTTGTVTSIDGAPGAETLTVNFDNRGPITVPHDWLTAELRPGITGGLTPAYAVTSHAAQGDTYRTGRIIATDTARTEAVYVGLTRGSHDARIYTVRNEPHTLDTDPRLPRIEDPRTEIEALTEQLSKQKPTELAVVANPDIGRVLDLTRLPLEELDASNDPLARHAQNIVESRIAHQARNNPDPALIAHLGPRPTNADLAKIWDDGVGAVAVYRAQTGDPAALPGVQSNTPSDEPGVPRRISAMSEQRKWPASASAPLSSLPPDETISSPRPDCFQRPTSGCFAPTSTKRSRPWPLCHQWVRQVRPSSDADADSAIGHAERRLAEGVESNRALTRLEDQVERIDDALAPRIRTAVNARPSYLTETLGERTAAKADRWDAAATAIETYRHATLGIEPSQGPLDQQPAIGSMPTNPIAAEAWASSNALIHDSKDRPLGISK